jgi:hypothetical protein
MMMRRPKRGRHFGGGCENHGSESGQVGGIEEGPGRHASASGQEGGADQQDGAGSCAGDEQPARSAVFEPVAARGQKPQHGQHGEQPACGDSERGSSSASGPRDERTHRREHEDLQQECAARAGILAAVQLMVETAVEPRDPHQGKDHSEVGESAPAQMQRKLTGVLGDQHDDGEVVEEF